jgi:hypothetical protein
MLTISLTSLLVVVLSIALFVVLFVLAAQNDKKKYSYLGFWGVVIMSAFGTWHFVHYLVRSVIAILS